MNPVPIVHLLAAILIAALAVPLIRRKVRMNGWYGVRIQAAFQSEHAWYDINHYGGRLLLVWSAAIAATATAGLFVTRKYWLTYNWSALVIIMGGLATIFAMIQRYARRRTAA